MSRTWKKEKKIRVPNRNGTYNLPYTVVDSISFLCPMHVTHRIFNLSYFFTELITYHFSLFIKIFQAGTFVSLNNPLSRPSVSNNVVNQGSRRYGFHSEYGIYLAI